MIVPELGSISRKELEARLEELRSTGEVTTELVDVMFEIDARGTFGGNLTFRFEDEVRSYSEQLGYERGECWVTITEAAKGFLQSDHQKALTKFTRARKIAEGLGDRSVEHFILVALGDVHKSLGNYEVALRYTLDALPWANEHGDELQIGWLYHGLAAGSNDLGDHARALEYANEALRFFETVLERMAEPQATAGVGRCRTEIGTAFQHLGRLDEAEREHQASLELYQSVDNRMGEARALNDLGRLKQDRGEFDEAEHLHRESLRIRKEINNRQSQATSLLNLGELYVARGDVDQGIEHLTEALAIADETGARVRQYQIHSALASAFEIRDDFRSALEHARKFHTIKEQVSNDSLNGRIADMQMRFEIETAEQEAEIERLRNVELKKTLDELRTAQDRLVHAEKMASLGSMTAGIAHEIKNPLNFVNNFAAMSIDLADELEDRLSLRSEDDAEIGEILKDVRENAERILDHGQRADRIVKNMLLHAGGNSADRTLFDLNEIVSEYVGLAYHGARATDSSFNVAIDQDLDPELPKINGVPQEIGRVILNLLGNAFDALKKDEQNDSEKKVAITTSTIDHGVELVISDNGPGIPDELRDRIFEPFFTTKPAGDGTGLGLSLSYDIIVQGHGGEFGLEDRSGLTTFVIRLPQ